jgi:hypothetical protein
MAYGGGFLWMAANGKSLWRDPKPTDATTGDELAIFPFLILSYWPVF